jgi:hypothetical protein
LIRLTLAAFVVILAAGSPGGGAKADPYRWCAEYGGDLGGAKNCYFVTLEQCRATVSGTGGTCSLNPFYDGRPADNSRQRQERPVRWPFWFW